MPGKKKTETAVTTTSLELTIQENLATLKEYPESLEVTEQVICEFYTGHPNCRGCLKQEDVLMNCRDEYIATIPDRPMLNWAPEFDALEQREATTFEEYLGLHCDTCYLSDYCPKFKRKSTCAIKWESDISKLKPKEMVNKLIDLQNIRVQRARMVEEVDGGVPDRTLSDEMDRLSDLIAMRDGFDQEKFSMQVTASGPSKEGGGILSQIFGKKEEPALPPAVEHETIDVPSSTIEIIEPEAEPVKRTRRRNGESKEESK